MRFQLPHYFVVLGFAAMVWSPPAGAQTLLVENIEATAPLIRLPMNTGGRIMVLETESDGTVYRSQWPGVYFAAAFTGPRVYFKTGPGDVILHILVDDRPAIPLIKPRTGVHRVEGLSEGPHTIRIEVVTESQRAPINFGGFFLTESGSTVIPPRLGRQIEILGDSHTVGYGNTYSKRECTPEIVWSTTDTSQAFGVLTAKYYRADYEINAISGRGIVRNYNGGTSDPLPAVYPYVLFDQKVEAADRNWQPQIIVVALGTNDFSTPLHAGEKWPTRDALHVDFERSYVALVRHIREKNPRAFFILAANDAANGEIQTEVRKVVEQLKAAGENRVDFVAFNNLELTACDWHPSLTDHRAMAAALEQFIDARPEIWSGH